MVQVDSLMVRQVETCVEPLQINYYLDESDGWGLSRVELERALTEGRKVAEPRAIVVINPGNPTGQVLTRSNMEQVIRFAYDERLVILADEVSHHPLVSVSRLNED